MNRLSTLFACVLLFFIGIGAGLTIRTAHADDMKSTRTKPTDGWSLHIDAKLHFATSPTQIAHHYCKPVSGGLTECQIYDSDAADARLVAVETIVSPDVWKSLSPSEQAMWHYHRTEVPKVDVKFPDLSPEAAAKVTASILDTYGKVYVLWDPAKSANPTGSPIVTILK